MKTNPILFLLLVMYAFCSCSNDEISESIDQEKLLMNFTYDGKYYESTYTYNSDSIMVFDDKITGDIYEKLQEIPTLAMLVKEDGSIHYFDDLAQLNSYLHFDENKTKALLNSGIRMWFTLYEHDNYRGKNITVDGYNSIELAFPRNGSVNINDLITSFTANYEGSTRNYSFSGCRMDLYDNDTFTGRTISFILSRNSSREYAYGEVKIPQLKNYQRTSGGLFSKHRTWNDCVSSAKLYLY